MGFRSTSTRRTTAASAVSSQAVIINSGNTAPSGSSPVFTASGSSIAANTSISLGVTTVGQTSASTVTTVSAGPAVTTIQYLDANNAVVSGSIAASTTGGNILITGSGFVANSNVYVNNTLVSNTFISSTQIRAILPSASAGNVSLMIFTPTNVGTIRTNGVRYSGAPTWTTAAVTFQNNTTANVALVASSDSTLTYTLQAGSTLPTGITLNSAGYLAGTATGYTVNSSTTAVVVATDQEGQATQQTLNITITVADPQFPYTTLLLNGETSVTPFIDDGSTNNFPLTIAGDTKANKFSPYYGDGYYSVQFNGTVNDYLSIPHNSNLSIMTGSTNTFIAECWVNWAAVNASCVIMDKSGRNGVSFQNWAVELDASKQIKLVWGASGTPGSSAIGVLTTTTIPVPGVWYHIALVKSNADWSLFINGTRSVTYNGLNTANDANPSALRIGLGIDGEYNGGYMSGYISNVRIYNGPAGSAPYSATSTTITVPTAPLTANANIYALTNQSARYLDNSSTAATLTAGSGIKVSSVMPFAASSSYATYGSAYFDGTGDYLTIPDSNAFAFGTGNFTVEAWVYTANVSASPWIVGQWEASAGSDTNSSWQIATSSSKFAGYMAYNNSVAQIALVGTSTIQNNTWNHVALVRNGATGYLYVNGVAEASNSAVASYSLNNSTLPVYIGQRNGGTQSMNGHVSDVRVVSNTAVYTTTFTPPTAPLTAVANTQLLALQYNGGANNYGIIDNGPFNNTVTRVGNATQGSFSPYSQIGWSNFFNGTTDYLYTSAAAISTNDFTIECWFNASSFSASPVIIDYRTTTTNGAYPLIYLDTTGAPIYFVSAAAKITGSALSLNTWYHIAVSRSGTNTKMFVNGTQVGSTWTDTTNYVSTTTRPIVGTSGYSSAGFFTGYISNLRVVNGTAVYTSNFTPSATPLTAVTNTVWLIAQSNRFKDNSTNNSVLTGGTPSVQAYSPFSPSAAYTPSLHGGSAYFDGTGDYLTLPGSNATNLGSSSSTAFTVEAWVYPTVSKDTTVVGCKGSVWRLALTPGNLVSWVFNTSSVQTSTDAIKLNQWNHIAFTYDGLNLGSSNKMFVNGVVQAAQGQLIPPSNTTDIIYVGRNADSAAWDFQGYIADVRIIRGFAAYTANFTLPTAPLTSPTATPASLLLNFNNGGVIDQSGKIVFDGTSAVQPQINTNITKYGRASLQLTGNYMFNTTANQNLVLGTGDFTVECWIYWVSTNYNGGVVGLAATATGQAIDIHSYLSTGYVYFAGTARSIGTLPIGTWNHYAIVRQSGTTKFYLDGVYNATVGAVADSTNYTGGILQLGYYQSNLTSNAYIDDLRITKGFARYTANFTPPTTGFLGL